MVTCQYNKLPSIQHLSFTLCPHGQCDSAPHLGAISPNSTICARQLSCRSLWSRLVSRPRGGSTPPAARVCLPASSHPAAGRNLGPHIQKGTPTRSLVFGRAASTPAPASSKHEGRQESSRRMPCALARHSPCRRGSERYVSRPVILLIRTLERVSTPPIHPHVPPGHSPRPPLGAMLHNRKAKCRCSAQRADLPPRAQAQRWSRCSASCWPWRPSWRWPMRRLTLTTCVAPPPLDGYVTQSTELGTGRRRRLPFVLPSFVLTRIGLRIRRCRSCT